MEPEFIVRANEVDGDHKAVKPHSEDANTKQARGPNECDPESFTRTHRSSPIEPVAWRPHMVNATCQSDTWFEFRANPGMGHKKRERNCYELTTVYSGQALIGEELVAMEPTAEGE